MLPELKRVVLNGIFQYSDPDNEEDFTLEDAPAYELDEWTLEEMGEYDPHTGHYGPGPKYVCHDYLIYATYPSTGILAFWIVQPTTYHPATVDGQPAIHWIE